MGTWYGNWRKFPENWRSRDRLYPERWTGNSSISESQFQIQTTLWAYLGWCPRTPLRAFMVAWVWPHAQQTLSLCTQASRMSLLWEPGPSHLGTFHVFKLLHSESKRVIFGNPLLWATYLCLIPTTLGWALKSVSKQSHFPALLTLFFSLKFFVFFVVVVCFVFKKANLSYMLGFSLWFQSHLKFTILTHTHTHTRAHTHTHPLKVHIPYFKSKAYEKSFCRRSAALIAFLYLEHCFLWSWFHYLWVHGNGAH